MRHFFLALRFLTRYPIRPLAEEPSGADHARSTGYFPLVGFAVGLELMLFRTLVLMDPVGMHQPLWDLLILLYWIWVCDSLHLDGLADTCDALASRGEGPEMLRILHDPRLGTFGVLSLVLAVLARWCWLRYLPQQFIWFFPLPLVASRLFLSLACQARPYAGNEASLSSQFILGSEGRDANRALGFALGSFFLLAAPCIYFGSATALDAGLALGVCAAGILSGWIMLRLPRRRLGGVNGDLLGYGQQITELSTAFGLFFILVRQ